MGRINKLLAQYNEVEVYKRAFIKGYYQGKSKSLVIIKLLLARKLSRPVNLFGLNRVAF